MTASYGLAMFALGLLTGIALSGIAVAWFIYRVLKADQRAKAQQAQRKAQPWWVQDVTDGALVVRGYEDVQQ